MEERLVQPAGHGEAEIPRVLTTDVVADDSSDDDDDGHADKDGQKNSQRRSVDAVAGWADVRDGFEGGGGGRAGVVRWCFGREKK